MKANVEHINLELPATKTLRKEIDSQKRKAFKEGRKLNVVWRKSV